LSDKQGYEVYLYQTSFKELWQDKHTNFSYSQLVDTETLLAANGYINRSHF
jgi:hypothetical protein